MWIMQKLRKTAHIEDIMRHNSLVGNKFRAINQKWYDIFHQGFPRYKNFVTIERIKGNQLEIHCQHHGIYSDLSRIYRSQLLTMTRRVFPNIKKILFRLAGL